ncbi:MAG: hypothetical protein IPM51_02740 [Sphingobacteriaceae bacterium]|nr:hypothetical protein [Sphingobacteriaceae bacterium]
MSQYQDQIINNSLKLIPDINSFCSISVVSEKNSELGNYFEKKLDSDFKNTERIYRKYSIKDFNCDIGSFPHIINNKTSGKKLFICINILESVFELNDLISQFESDLSEDSCLLFILNNKEDLNKNTNFEKNKPKHVNQFDISSLELLLTRGFNNKIIGKCVLENFDPFNQLSGLEYLKSDKSINNFYNKFMLKLNYSKFVNHYHQSHLLILSQISN